MDSIPCGRNRLTFLTGNIGGSHGLTVLLVQSAVSRLSTSFPFISATAHPAFYMSKRRPLGKDLISQINKPSDLLNLALGKNFKTGAA